MIITGIFLFLLGTKLGHAATKTQVKYEGPNKITVNENKDDCVILPGLASPPFAPSFLHQGSNFFFSPQIVMPPPEIIPTGIERIIAPQPINEVMILNPEVNREKIIETVELVVPELPKIELIEPNPPVQILVEEPYVDIGIKNIVPNVPMFIEEPIRPASGLFRSEIGVQSVYVNEIPPPPQLPPLILTEIPRPVIDNKRVVLVPSAPELTKFYPPSMVVPENPLFPVDCAQNIVFERVLPNLASEYGKTIELISIPASKRAPVVSSIVY